MAIRLQVSAEMLEFADDGYMYWEKMMHVITAMFAKWDHQKVQRTNNCRVPRAQSAAVS